MADCASQQIQDSGDALIAEVEGVVAAPKFASSFEEPHKSLFRSPNRITMRVRSVQRAIPDLLLIGTQAGPNRIGIDLVRERDRQYVYGQFHKQVSRHINPDGGDATSLHIHFPTKDYALTPRHRGDTTWACPVSESPTELIAALKYVCKLWNIEIRVLEGTFIWQS